MDAYGCIWENPCRIALRLEFLPIEPQRSHDVSRLQSRDLPMYSAVQGASPWKEVGQMKARGQRFVGRGTGRLIKIDGSMGYGHAQDRM